MAGALLLWAGGAWAQDRRTVTEPVIPPSCAVLTAQLGISGGEPTSETAFDTARLQSALTACPAGQAVELVRSGNNVAFLIQPIDIPSGVTLLVDAGVTVFASRNPADYQAGTVSSSLEQCGTVGTLGNGCKNLISVNHGNTSTGSAIMGYGVIDGRGQDKLLVNGAASTQSWWDLAAAANGTGDQNNFVILQTSKANSFTLYGITLKNSPMFHVQWRGTGFTAWGVKVITPYTARNSDGIDPGGSDITITRSWLSDGDDEVAVSASAASSYITLSNLQTYSGHGISVGSYTQGGLTNLLVDHVNMAGTAADGNANGLRLKSAQDRGGLVQNVTWQNLCVKDVRKNLLIDPFYNSNSGSSPPRFSNLVLRNAHFLTEGRVGLQGFDAAHSTSITFDNVVFDSLASGDLSPAPSYTAVTLGPGAVYPSLLQSLSGTGVTTTGSAPAVNTGAYDCTNAFPTLVGELILTAGTSTNLKSASLSGPATFTLEAMLQPAMSQVTYGAWTGLPALTQAVDFLEGASVVGSAALGANGTLATLTLSNVGNGTHTYVARYPGDATHAAHTFGSVTVTVNAPAQLPSTTQATIPSAASYGDSITLSATITGAGAQPTGTVTFNSGAVQLGSAQVSAGTASVTAPLTLGIGSHPVIARYSGDSVYSPSDTSAAPVTLVVSAAPTVTTLVLPSASVPAGSQVTLVAHVAAQGGTPDGLITFQQGGMTIDTAALSSGTASLKVSPASVGTLQLVASYAGSGNFDASTSTVTPLSVTAPFTLTADHDALALAPGATETVTLTLTPQSGFTGVAAITCVSGSVGCALSAPSQTVSGANPITFTAKLTAGGVAALRSPPTHSLPALGPMLALLLWSLRARVRWRKVFTIFSVLCALAIGACGGSTVPSQTVTITATSNGFGVSAKVNVILQ
ncbi:MAG: Ig-like domain repeat protein [Deltaproteobacteria bacterium]|nr:Ig-like domain repeat protein [Deltaproteobacteria bacterium]